MICPVKAIVTAGSLIERLSFCALILILSYLYLTLSDRSFVCFVLFFKAKQAGKQNWWFENWWDSETVQCTLFKCAIIGIWQFARERIMESKIEWWSGVWYVGSRTPKLWASFPSRVRPCVLLLFSSTQTLLMNTFYNVFHVPIFRYSPWFAVVSRSVCGEKEKDAFSFRYRCRRSISPYPGKLLRKIWKSTRTRRQLNCVLVSIVLLLVVVFIALIDR